MNGFFKDFKNDRVMSGGFVVTFITIFLTFIYILISLQSFPPYIPLFNQLPWGDQRLGTTFTIFIPLGIATLIAVLNIVICSFIYKKSQIISRLLAVTSALVTFLSFLLIIRTTVLIT